MGLVVAGLVITVVLGVVFILKWTGFTAFGDRSKLVDAKAIVKVSEGVDAIATDLKNLDRRVAAVEKDVGDRATRQEVHDLQLSIARMEGRFDLMEASMKAIGGSVTRMEDFLLRISERGK
ncbi:hypothetical protein FP2506_11492 [Fulvimarina pelagi HTCC2506]|uniref:DUF2730 family protein n=1 Tax=Fulvimarina pelagi HTCC2506 TaxID=314231 RepID=Q0FYY1_9HYPH|nr:hypothetical protein FP2506_11492 [Fulvimarina pelagi HTCC2506]